MQFGGWVALLCDDYVDKSVDRFDAKRQLDSDPRDSKSLTEMIYKNGRKTNLLSSYRSKISNQLDNKNRRLINLSLNTQLRGAGTNILSIFSYMIPTIRIPPLTDDRWSDGDDPTAF